MALPDSSDLAAASFAEREKRFNDIVALRKPDRVPVIPLEVHYFPTKVKGISNRDAGYDDVRRYGAIRDAVVEFGWDFAVPSGLLPSAGLEALGTLQFRWPGGDLPDDAPFQFVEEELVGAGEYEQLLADPDRFILSRVFPRVASAFAGLEHTRLPPIHWLANAYHMLHGGAALLTTPGIKAVLEALLRLTDAAQADQDARRAHIAEMAALGYPYGYQAVTTSAFDQVSSFFRGLLGSLLDIYRRPDELLAAVEMMVPCSIGTAVGAAAATANPRVFIPLHRGADNFMSGEDFERFYWPGLLKLIDALIAEGLTPIPLFEGSYDTRLKYLAQLPPGKVAGHFDQVDRGRFKETCGDVMCFWGNVPASLMCTGTPEQVKDDVKRLIDLFGDTGTLIVDANLGIPDEAPPENVLALREAVDEFGVL